MVKNPACKPPGGCGPWTQKKMKNPAYQGVWAPKKIKNPEYKGTSPLEIGTNLEAGFHR